jgi:O-antigen/teichoic acid export membrane protein
MTWYYAPELVGYYAMGMRLLNIPLNMISMSVGQVFFQQISRYVKNKLPVFKFLWTTGLKLALIGFPGLLIIFLFGPVLFRFIFGENWGEAGTIASILAPYFFFRFIASPLSPIFALVGKQYLSMIWQGIYTGLTFLVLYLGHEQLDFSGVVILYSGISAVMFLIFLVMELQISHTFDREIKQGGYQGRFT